MEIRGLFAYSDNCRRLLRDTLSGCPHVFDRPFETTSAWRTIRLLLAHSIGAEERWITMRIGGQALPSDYEERAATTPAALFADADAVRAVTYRFLDGLEPGGLVRVVPVSLTDWRGDLTVEQILFHIVNHENYHRGQIVMTLQRFGLDPPNFDYVFLHD